MSSYPYGKDDVCRWIREHFPPDASVLDVGACDAVWRRMLPEYANMDAVEVFHPNIEKLTGYRNVFEADIRCFAYEHYDLIIFGDVIEHMPVEDAQRVLEYAKQHCVDMVVAVPFLYKQGMIYGNPYEVHVQDDLTAELFSERYPGFTILCKPADDYCYYSKA